MKKIARLICLMTALAGGSFLYADAELNHALRLVSYEPYYFENGYILLNKVIAQETTVFIDVGSSEGMAARYISANTSESVKVFNINSWSGNDHRYQKFLSNVIHENQGDRIHSIRMSSREATDALNLVSELIYIDCEDKNTVHEKILSWATHLSLKGVIAGNRWEWPEVELAVVHAVVDLGLTLNIEGNFWFLKKPE